MSYDEKPWFKSYDPDVAKDLQLTDETYVDIMEEGFRFSPLRDAMYFFGVSITYAELDAMSASFAAFLAKNGCGKGDVVAIHLPNVPQYMIALAGAMRAGCAISGVSALLTPKELAYQVHDSGAKVLVTLDMFFAESLMKVAGDVPKLEHVLVTGVADFLPMYKQVLGKLFKKIPTGKVESIKGKQVIPFLKVLKSSPSKKPDVKVVPTDVCAIQYTGGTTGVPKGTLLLHKNMVANLKQAETWSKYEKGVDVFCSGFPFFHQAGLIFGMTAMATANPQCLIPDPRNTKHISKEIRDHKATVIAMVPTLYQMLMDDPNFRKLDFSGIRACLSGAAPFSAESLSQLEAIVGKNKIIEIYGMTETAPLMTANPYMGTKKLGSVGLPLPGMRVKLVDVDTGTKEVPIGAEGELIVQGPQVMAGYHNKPEETTHALRDFDGEPWLFTGDIARMDEDGYMYIVDRTKDMLNVGGYKVFSREVEDKLYSHPAVDFVAIVGEKNPKRPESDIVKAVIQLKASHKGQDQNALKENILGYCKENMAAYKVPKIIEFTEAIPLTPVGKVDKKLLRK